MLFVLLQFTDFQKCDQGSDVPVNHLSGLVSLHKQGHERYKVLGKCSSTEPEKTE